MTYIINGKEYTKDDIDRSISLLYLGYYKEGFRFVNTGLDSSKHYIENFPYRRITKNKRHWRPFEPTTNPADTDAIIDKCWGELMSSKDDRGCGTWTHWDHVKWQRLMNEHNCTKLVAACICYIEINEAAL
jgi:hypothetical protein